MAAAARTITNWVNDAATGASHDEPSSVRGNPIGGKPYLLYWCYVAVLELRREMETHEGLRR